MKYIKLIALLLAFAIPATPYAAFKATTIAAEGALSSIRRQAAATRTYLVGQRALMVASTVNSTVPLSVIQHLATVIPTLTTLAATPGLLAYTQAQLNDPAYNIVTEFTAMRTAMVSVMGNLITMFPKDANGYLLYELLDANGIRTTRTFTAAQVAPAVALIDSLIATIE